MLDSEDTTYLGWKWEKKRVHSSLPHFSLVLIKRRTLETCQQGSVFIYTDGLEKREKKGRKLDAK